MTLEFGAHAVNLVDLNLTICFITSYISVRSKAVEWYENSAPYTKSSINLTTLHVWLPTLSLTDKDYKRLCIKTPKTWCLSCLEMKTNKSTSFTENFYYSLHHFTFYTIYEIQKLLAGLKYLLVFTSFEMFNT